MAFLSAASSSGTKPCVHHTSAVVAAALAIKGRASVPPAAKPRELRSTERRLRFPMSVSFPVLAPRGPSAGAFFVLTNLNWPQLAVGSTDFSASAYAPFFSRRTMSPITPGRDASGIWLDYIARPNPDAGARRMVFRRDQPLGPCHTLATGCP